MYSCINVVVTSHTNTTTCKCQLLHVKRVFMNGQKHVHICAMYTIHTLKHVSPSAMPSIWYSIYFSGFSRIYRAHMYTRTWTCTRNRMFIHEKVVRFRWIVGWLASHTRVYVHRRRCMCACECVFSSSFRHTNLTICHFHGTWYTHSEFSWMKSLVYHNFTCAQSNNSHCIHIYVHKHSHICTYTPVCECVHVHMRMCWSNNEHGNKMIYTHAYSKIETSGT